MDKGALQLEYAPPRGHPILYAGMLLTAVVFVMGSVENLLRDNKSSLYAAYLIPFFAVAFVYVALLPNTIRIYERGIEPARPLVMRWFKPFLTWQDLHSVYPVYYDVTGAFVSPFASSDGKVTMMGIGLEDKDGHLETIKFTPTRYIMHQKRSLGYKQAMPIVASAFEALGKPMVPDKEHIGEQDMAQLLRQANQPFMPFFVIVFLLISPAPLLAILQMFLPIWAALGLAILPALWVMLQSKQASRERNVILNRISKAS